MKQEVIRTPLYVVHVGLTCPLWPLSKHRKLKSFISHVHRPHGDGRKGPFRTACFDGSLHIEMISPKRSAVTHLRPFFLAKEYNAGVISAFVLTSQNRVTCLSPLTSSAACASCCLSPGLIYRHGSSQKSSAVWSLQWAPGSVLTLLPPCSPSYLCLRENKIAPKMFADCWIIMEELRNGEGGKNHWREAEVFVFSEFCGAACWCFFMAVCWGKNVISG